jgi:intracellular sulfur oxidation DsrE/DsrF family protein
MNEPTKKPISEEYLHAFLDGELAADEREHALRLLEEDAEFKAKMCELRSLKERVKGAYADLPPASARPGTRFLSPSWRQALVASVMLVVGLAGGWLAHDGSVNEPVYDRIAGLPDGYRSVALAGKVDPDKVVLHLDSNDPMRLNAVLDLAERFLAQRGDRGQVKIVVNNYGLNLLRQETSPHRDRIGAMASRHRNLEFVACGQSIARLSREGVVVDMLPQVHVVKSAISEILERMQQGWVYVKV